MVLYFPDTDTLRLAVTSGAVPPAVALAPCTASFDDAGRFWVQPSASLPRASQAELRRIGAQSLRSFDAAVTVELSCWLQLFPLERVPEPPVPTAQTPVLFELADPSLLPRLVGEVLRLGNDRQGFRWLDDGRDGRALLRVVGPPYYSLLRALDRDGQAAAPRAYVEQAPRVWVEHGYRHPFTDRLKQPEGSLLLMRPPRDWATVADGPFRDVYAMLDFALPAGPARWQDAGRTERLTVPLRLAAGGTSEPAELWVVKEDPVGQLDRLVQGADNHLLAPLSFAVGEHGGRQTVVVRARPSRQSPPVLALRAEEFRPYLKLPNLFLPCGRRLHPPLRRDAVRKLLAEDAEQVTWLYPGEGGAFTPESLPDRAFRPLSDWVDYVLDHEREALGAWTESTQFDFERFVCTDDDREARPRAKAERPAPRGKDAREQEGGGRKRAASFAAPTESAAAAEPDDPLPALRAVAPSELQKRLAALEAEFLALEGPLDAPERLGLWPRLAELYAALSNGSDAALCWVNALWEDADGVELATTWLHSEMRAVPGKTLAGRVEAALAKEQPSLAEVRLVAAAVITGAYDDRPDPALVNRLNDVRQFVQSQEGSLPVRVVWLTWLGLARLSRGDTLALARARDRVLERLFRSGMTAEHDLPSFLRFAGTRGSDRFRAFRDWFVRLPGKVERWLKGLNSRHKWQVKKPNPEGTAAYANLILAYGFAKVGETQEAQRLRQLAQKALPARKVDQTLLSAFCHRIDEAIAGAPLAGPLPPEVLQAVQGMEDRTDVFKVNRLREQSAILEPHERLRAEHAWTLRFYPADEAAAVLRNLTDRREVQDKTASLLGEFDDSYSQASVLKVALEIAPRVGEAFALALLEKVSTTYEGLKGAQATRYQVFEKRAWLLEKALLVAAHFQQAAHVQSLLRQFLALVQDHGGSEGSNELALVTSVAGACLRGLRKLGLRDEIHGLLRELEKAVTGGTPLAELRGGPLWPEVLQALLHLSGGWFYFGKDEMARPYMHEARQLLYKGAVYPLKQANLACAYVRALGQAPSQFGMDAIDELFQNLDRVWDEAVPHEHYSLTQLRVIEAVVTAVVSDDFAMGTMARRWLDDEEFLVRRRMHRDLHALMGG